MRYVESRWANGSRTTVAVSSVALRAAYAARSAGSAGTIVPANSGLTSAWNS